MVTLLLKSAFSPLYLLWLAVEEVTGGGRAYRRRYRSMVERRPGMGPMEFALTAGVVEADMDWALAVRDALADSTGLPADAIHAHDPLDEFWAMQIMGPDFLDLMFRLEKRTMKQIPRGICDDLRPLANDCETIGDFARALATAPCPSRSGGGVATDSSTWVTGCGRLRGHVSGYRGTRARNLLSSRRQSRVFPA